MKKYICSVCGYDYDETAGDPGNGVAPGTKWEDLPDDWVCPICGADKSMFSSEGGEDTQPMRGAAQSTRIEGNVSAKQLAVMCSNLTRGADKQYRAEMSGLFTELSDYYEARSEPGGGLNEAHRLLNDDISLSYVEAFDAARGANDRGALRALTWGEKVSKIQTALISRWLKEGDRAFEGSKFFVCDACGFIFAGDQAPEICPVCKVPRFKFSQIQRGA